MTTVYSNVDIDYAPDLSLDPDGDHLDWFSELPHESAAAVVQGHPVRVYSVTVSPTMRAYYTVGRVHCTEHFVDGVRGVDYLPVYKRFELTSIIDTCLDIHHVARVAKQRIDEFARMSYPRDTDCLSGTDLRNKLWSLYNPNVPHIYPFGKKLVIDGERVLYREEGKPDTEWDPVTNLAHALELFERLSSGMWGASQVHYDGDCFDPPAVTLRVWEGAFEPRQVFAFGDTFAEAVCRAAVIMVEDTSPAPQTFAQHFEF